VRALPSVAERLAAKTAPPAANGCTVFTGARIIGTKGYGRLRVGKKTVAAHRVAWQLAHGPIAPGLFVCHTCDNPPCVNVEHLFLGTHADNMADMARKGRGVSPRVGKITAQDAQDIRDKHARGVTTDELATQYGLHPWSVVRVIKRETWAA
jgi:hypothetical protein